MKKIISILIVFYALFGVAGFVLAEATSTTSTSSNGEGYIQTQLSAAAGYAGAGYGTPKDPRAIIATITKFSLGFVGTLFLVYSVYGGFLVLVSGGEEEKITKGKKILLYGTIGIFIILSAYSIVLFVDRYMRFAQAPVQTETDGWEWTTDEDTSQFMNPDPLFEENPEGSTAIQNVDLDKSLKW